MQEYVHGEMDVRAQQKLFRGFIKFIVQVCIVIAMILIFMAAFLT